MEVQTAVSLSNQERPKTQDKPRRFKACAVCGKNFEVKGNRALYCSSRCKRERKLEKNRDAYRRKKAGREDHHEKPCAHCGAQFEVHGGIYCKEEGCKRERRIQSQRKAYLADPEAYRKKARKWRALHHDKVLEDMRNYRAANREKFRAFARADYAKHREKRKQQSREWYARWAEKAAKAERIFAGQRRKSESKIPAWVQIGQRVEGEIPTFEKLFALDAAGNRNTLRRILNFSRAHLDAADYALFAPSKRPMVAARYFVSAEMNHEYKTVVDYHQRYLKLRRGAAC